MWFNRDNEVGALSWNCTTSICAADSFPKIEVFQEVSAEGERWERQKVSSRYWSEQRNCRVGNFFWICEFWGSVSAWLTDWRTTKKKAFFSSASAFPPAGFGTWFKLLRHQFRKRTHSHYTPGVCSWKRFRWICIITMCSTDWWAVTVATCSP